jgi:hypothetical protein
LFHKDRQKLFVTHVFIAFKNDTFNGRILFHDNLKHYGTIDELRIDVTAVFIEPAKLLAGAKN